MTFVTNDRHQEDSMITAESLRQLHARPEAPAATTDAFQGVSHTPRSGNTRRTNTPATQAQADFIRKLLAERAGNPAAEAVRARLNQWREGEGLNVAGASWAIEALKEIAKNATDSAPVRVNRFPGKCESCGKQVAAEAGRLSKDDEGKWQVWHLTGECPATTFSFPDGHYAVDSPEGELRFIFASDDGLFFQAGSEYHPVHGSIQKHYIDAVAADPFAASVRYGQELGHCGRCGRELTNEASREAGIGPVCAGKGW